MLLQQDTIGYWFSFLSFLGGKNNYILDQNTSLIYRDENILCWAHDYLLNLCKAALFLFDSSTVEKAQEADKMKASLIIYNYKCNTRASE